MWLLQIQRLTKYYPSFNEIIDRTWQAIEFEGAT